MDDDGVAAVQVVHPLGDVQRHAHATRLVQRRAHPGGLRPMQQLVQRPPVKKFRDDGEVGRLRHRPHQQNHVRVPQPTHQVHLAGELPHELRREILVQKTFHRNLRPAPQPAVHLAVRTDADAFPQLDRLRRDGQIHRDGEHRGAVFRRRFFQTAAGGVPRRPGRLLRIRRDRRRSLRRGRSLDVDRRARHHPEPTVSHRRFVPRHHPERRARVLASTEVSPLVLLRLLRGSPRQRRRDRRGRGCRPRGCFVRFRRSGRLGRLRWAGAARRGVRR